MFEKGNLARYVNIVLGVWLMAAPSILSYGPPAQTNDRIFGPIAVTFATVAIWETTRVLRWGNFWIGLWLIAAPWILGYGTTPLINSVLVGAVIAGLALIRGDITDKFGLGWSSLWPLCDATPEQQNVFDVDEV